MTVVPAPEPERPALPADLVDLAPVVADLREVMAALARLVALSPA
jgi:hypothetical protein